VSQKLVIGEEIFFFSQEENLPNRHHKIVEKFFKEITQWAWELCIRRILILSNLFLMDVLKRWNIEIFVNLVKSEIFSLVKFEDILNFLWITKLEWVKSLEECCAKKKISLDKNEVFKTLFGAKGKFKIISDLLFSFDWRIRFSIQNLFFDFLFFF